MPSNNTEQISRYLQQEMSAEEKYLFEKQVADDPALREEIAVQQQIIKAAEAAGIKAEFGKAIRKKIIGRRLLRWGLPALVVTAFVIYAIKTNLFFRHQPVKDKAHTAALQQFEISNARDTIIETGDGVVFAIPAGAFDTHTGTVRLEIKTALTPYDIMRQGLSTVSNGSLLQTAGMFYINGYEGDMPLAMLKDIQVSVPAREVNPAMQLFDGVADSSGNINWVNPKPVGRQLRTYDITTLDFYPPDYIPTLKALGKDYLNKKYTDSLYYSFSGYPGNNKKDTVLPKPAASVPIEENVPINNQVQINGPSAQFQFDQIQDSIMQWPGDSDVVVLDKYDNYHYEIDPARIGAVWNEKYNNTILATKEFEERLKYMHGLCTSIYFDMYLHNLDKPMYQVDGLCADNAGGAVRKKFRDFAKRKDGSVFINEGMQGMLNQYFAAKYKAFQQAALSAREKYQAELNRLNAIADEKSREQAVRDLKRDSSIFWEEYCINLTHAYQQIGISRHCNDTIPAPPAKDYYNVTISTPGWKNLDMYVFDATVTRQSMQYTDPVTGKKAALIYKDITLAVNNMEQYDKVLVYLVPDSLSSFQRMEQQGNIFKESLNALFRYNVVALGYKGTQAFEYRQAAVQPGNYSVDLSSVSNEELKTMLEQYSASKQRSLQEEWNYQLFEQQEAERQVQVRMDMDFRSQVAAAIFKCYAADTSKSVQPVSLK